MKTSFNLGLFVVGAALLATPTAFAQDGTTGGTTGGTTSNSTGGAMSGSETGNTTSTTERTTEREEGPDLGWLGLLGLAGLAGLLKKPERQVVHHTDTVRTTGTGTGTNR